jgi:hypothetical protein
LPAGFGNLKTFPKPEKELSKVAKRPDKTEKWRGDFQNVRPNITSGFF